MLECRLIRKQVLPMPILHVRNVPEELYEQIRRRAELEQRSISAEVTNLLQTALNQAERPQARSWKEFAAGASTAL